MGRGQETRKKSVKKKERGMGKSKTYVGMIERVIVKKGVKKKIKNNSEQTLFGGYVVVVFVGDECA